MRYWCQKIEEESNNIKASKFLVAAKVDLSDKEAIGIGEASTFANEVKAELLQTSAKEGTGVIELFTKVAEKVYANSMASAVVTSQS